MLIIRCVRCRHLCRQALFSLILLRQSSRWVPFASSSICEQAWTTDLVFQNCRPIYFVTENGTDRTMGSTLLKMESASAKNAKFVIRWMTEKYISEEFPLFPLPGIPQTGFAQDAADRVKSVVVSKVVRMFEY